MVTGVSRDPEKFGSRVYRALKSAGYEVFAVNPYVDCVDGDPCYPSISNVPAMVDCLVTVTPPQFTLEHIKEAGHLRIPFVWMQPGSESNSACNLAYANSMETIAGGAVILVALEHKRPGE